MGDDVIPGRDLPPENPFKGLLPEFGRDVRGLARQQVRDARQELRSTVDGAENRLLELFGIQRDGKTLSGNMGGIALSRTGSEWSLNVGDFTFSRSRSGLNLGLDDTFQFADSPSGWSIKVGNALDMSHSATETKVKVSDPLTDALFSLDKTRQGFDLEGRQLAGTSFKVEKTATGESLHVESDGLVFDIKKTGGKVLAAVESPLNGSAYIFTEDPLTKTLSICDLKSGSTLSIQKTGLRTFKSKNLNFPNSISNHAHYWKEHDRFLFHS